MANVVWKYKLEAGRNEIEMPDGAHVISAVPDGTGNASIYALVNEGPAVSRSRRVFRMTGTGVPAEELQDLRRLKFIATVQWAIWVWHIFEVKTGGV